MEFVRFTIIPTGFFAGLILVGLIIVAIINGELDKAFDYLIRFIERYKLIISIILGLIFSIIAAVISRSVGSNTKAAVISAFAVVLNGPILKEAAVWILQVLSGMVYTASDPFSNAIMFLILLVPVLLVALIMCVILFLFFTLTTVFPVTIVGCCIDEEDESIASKISLTIYMIIHFAAMGFLAIGMY